MTGISVGRALVVFILAAGCGSPRPASDQAAPALLDSLEERTFHYFWDETHPRTRLVPDRAPTPSFASISATGFGLTAYMIGCERAWVTRDDAARRVLDTFRFLRDAPQDSLSAGSAGYRGFFYHFLEPSTGHRFEQVELSTMDTALLLAGVLSCQSYFDRASPLEDSIRVMADTLFARVDWRWASVRPPSISHGWTPESGFLPYDWRGYNEAMLVYLLALGSPTYPVTPDAWGEWTSGYQWGEFYGEPHVGFAPLFGHEYTHLWVDFRGIRDAYMREASMDYFENSRRAVRAQHAYARANPGGWEGYGATLWGLSACDGPTDGVFELGGVKREFHTYWARGASFTGIHDDGTVSPPAMAAAIVFAPELVEPALRALHDTYGDRLFGTYGLLGAVNPTIREPLPFRHGGLDPEHGWIANDYLGIDEGALIGMLENHRSGLVWRTMRRNPHLLRGLKAAGFTGGWLDSVAAASGATE